MNKRYLIDRYFDYGGHEEWYLIPADKTAAWEAWKAGPQLQTPPWATPILSPRYITFENPHDS